MIKFSPVSQKLFKSYFFGFLFSFLILFIFIFLFLNSLFLASREALIVFGFTYLLASLVLSVFMSYRFAKPISRITEKALRISNRRLHKEAFNAEDIFQDEDNEFSDLELALEKLNKNYRANQDQLNTERLEAEAIITQIQEAVLITDDQGGLRFYNERFLQHFIDPQLRGQKIFLHQIFRQPDILNLFKSLKTSTSIQRKEIEIRSQLDSSYRTYTLTLSALKKNNSEVDSAFDILALFYDITEIKKAERIRIDFVSNASHELKTPLTSIKGYVETIRSDLNEKRYNELGGFINIVAKNVDKLTELVQDLLNLSKLETFKEIIKTQCDILMLAESIVQELQPEITKKNLVIKFKFAVDTLKADEKKLEQVLRNLMTNAVRYTPNGGTVSIETAPSATSVFLKVIDNGPGIDPVHHSRLFERFYRIDEGRSRDQGGTGLGLAIVKHIMLSHGGNVKVESSVGVGSEFVCEFPK